MNKKDSNNQIKFLTYFSVFLVWAMSTGYGISQSVAESANRYETSELTIRLIQIGLSLPLLFIYLAIAFASVTFMSYTSRILGAKEYQGYKLLAKGLYLTLLSYMVTGIFGIIQRKLTGNSVNNMIIVRNAITISIGLATYSLFFQGSRQLLKTLKSNHGLGKLTKSVLFIISLVGATYVTLVFQNPYRTSSTEALIKPTYALPDALILTTVVLPYIITWTLGILAVVNLMYYSKNVSGVIFKALFKNLAQGFGLVIALSIALQMIGQFSDFWASSGLQSILLLIAVIFVALVTGYWFVGKAARELDRVETI